eukprot:Polyplicarium_translucidae@DN4502_c0_g1_i1.p1
MLGLNWIDALEHISGIFLHTTFRNPNPRAAMCAEECNIGELATLPSDHFRVIADVPSVRCLSTASRTLAELSSGYMSFGAARDAYAAASQSLHFDPFNPLAMHGRGMCKLALTVMVFEQLAKATQTGASFDPVEASAAKEAPDASSPSAKA